MSKVDVFASGTHYLDHLAPVWAALHPSIRGRFITSKSEAHERAKVYGIEAEMGLPGATLTIVASWADYRKTQGPVVYMEHGVGHTYSNQHPSYAGSPGKERVELFLNPNSLVQDLNTETYPQTPQKVVGVPKLDWLTVRPPTGRTAAISFHWDCKVAPEAGTALPHYRRILPKLIHEPGFDILGHSHPRPGWPEKMKRIYALSNIPFERDFDRILDKADVYIVDVSSTAYEFAAAGRHVIHLNSPRYRRNTNHGLRFWEHLPGPMVDNEGDLPDMIRHVLDYPEQYEAQRQATVNTVTPHLGKATKRAAATIYDFVT